MFNENKSVLIYPSVVNTNKFLMSSITVKSLYLVLVLPAPRRISLTKSEVTKAGLANKSVRL